ncbi:MAG TPA: hypothetical protein VJ596_03340 [Gemmatimonadaceae bacterium]|nr:hypothetical protein [Gemmatimonadaceae bacterium]
MFAEWRARRVLRAKAAAYVATLFADVPTNDVEWLARHGTGGDADHARWELRYAKRAIGLLTAKRDALDDKTASAVAHELAMALASDPNIDAGKLRVAERQLNARLRAYGEALSNREGAGSGWHMGRTLLEFAGRRETVPPEVVAHAGEVLANYLAEANEALRREFGSAALPEDVAPSSLR